MDYYLAIKKKETKLTDTGNRLVIVRSGGWG